ncbi:hypothetical protein [Tenacibaculum jejuense]|uniref:Uncharacterized protein n=1 Tax=Tenacibaculum jejuense TaxID=584609 RepID=A0A238U5M5_9FLAO|nr:hypothetical protein [Tenacibaculum jejuense]SNR14306.1 protein of unknown function [Tenacibaculum jejuense]
MRPSKINIVKALNKQLLDVHRLTNLIESKNSTSASEFRNWLFDTEEILKKNNLPQVSQISAIRAELITYIPSVKGKRKELYRFTARLLKQAQEDIWDSNTIFTQKTEQARELIQQLLNLVAQTKAFNFDRKTDFTHFLEGIWHFCNTHEQLRSITLQILGLLHKSDVLLVMAEEIDLNDF